MFRKSCYTLVAAISLLLLAVAPVYGAPSLSLGSTASYRLTGRVQASQSCTTDPATYASQACLGIAVAIPTVFVTIFDDGSCTPNGDPKCSFVPSFISLSQGGTVVWAVSGSLIHDIKSNDTANVGLPRFFGNLTAGGMVRVAFDVPGTYQYYDLNYNWMKGTILVTPSPPLPPPTPTSVQVDLTGFVGWSVEGLSGSQANLNVSHQISISIPLPIPGVSFTPLTESGSFEQSINLSTRVESPGTATSVFRSLLTLLPALSGFFLGRSSSVATLQTTGATVPVFQTTGPAVPVLQTTATTGPAFLTMLSGQSNSPVYTTWWVNGPLSNGSPAQILQGWSSVTGSESLNLGGSIGTRSAWIVTSQLSQNINVNIPNPNNLFNPATSNMAAKLQFLWSYDKKADLLLRNNDTLSLTMRNVTPTIFFTGTGQVPITITRDMALTVDLALLLSSTNLSLPKSASPTSTLMDILSAMPWMPLGLVGLAAGAAVALVVWFTRRAKGTTLPEPIPVTAPAPSRTTPS